MLRAVVHAALLVAPSAAQQFDLGHVQPVAAGELASFALADLDADGDLDLVGAFGGPELVAWFPNLGAPGGFGPARPIPDSVGGPSALAVGDLDGDGDADVLVGSYLTAAVRWHPNTDGAGAFGASLPLAAQAGQVLGLAAADLDGDGDVDAAATSWGGDELVWFENTDGAGGFGPALSIASPPLGLGSLAAADVDGDGDADLLAGGLNHVARFEHDAGAGGFLPVQLLAAGLDGVVAVRAADLDGDLDLDVLAVSHWQDALLWLENTDGDGAFGPARPLGSVYGPSDVLAADLDGDGDRDVLAVAGNYNDLAFVENLDGLGAFGALGYVDTTRVKPSGRVGAADLDGDGFLDPVSAAPVPGGSEIRWWTNLEPHLAADVGAISVAAGGAQALDLRAGPTHATDLYFLVGSASGTEPATPFGGLAWPLVLDPYSFYTVTAANGPVLHDTLGFLDAHGTATAAWQLAPGADPALAGIELHHAFGAFDLAAGGPLTLVSNAVALTLVP